jgi:RHS repeat-associated protein
VNKTDIEDMGLFTASNSATWNYQYDAMGNLISDKADCIVNISWTVSGKMKSIIREVGCMKPDLYFAYDASNNRVMKLVKHKDLNGNIAQEKNWDYTWYVRDAAGNVMATYAQTMEILPNNIYTESLEVNEWIIYGSSRVGVKKAKPGLTLITGSSFRSKGVRSDGSYIRENYTFGNSSVGIGLAGNGGNTPKYKGILSTYTAGLKQYELTNHLGNVMSVVTDRKTVQLTDGNTSGFNYQPDVVSATDYYPFGSVMPGRSFSSNAYRYGFSGFERDDEIKGSGNSVNMGDRMLDTRLGRTFKTDRHAYKYPYISPYAYALNSPLIVIDPDGKDVVILIAKDGAGGMGHMGALIQDKGGNWFYMTQGAADTEGGVSKMMSGGVQGGVMLQALNTTDIEEAIQIAKQDVNNSPYTDQVILKTSAKMDEKIFEKAKEVEKQTNSGDKKYNLLFNNCVDACQEPIEEGLGLNMPKDVDPRPNNYFEKLDKKLDKFQNKLDRQMKKESSPTTQSNQDLDFGSEDKLILGSEGY